MVYSLSKPVMNPYVDIDRPLFMIPRDLATLGGLSSLSRENTFQSNPALLPFDSTRVVTLSYANFYQNTFNASLLSLVEPINDKIGIGLSLSYLLIPNIDKNDLDSSIEVYDPTFITSSKVLIRSSIGYRLDFQNIQLGIGIAANMTRNRLEEVTGYGLGTDLGLKLLLKEPQFSLSVSVENVLGSYTYWNQNYSEYALPHVKVGFGWEREFPYIYGHLKLGYTSLDLLTNEGINDLKSVTTSGGEIEYEPLKTRFLEKPFLLISNGTYGLEYIIYDRVTLRGGMNPLFSRYSFGAGIEIIKNLTALDIAYISNQLDDTYQLSLTYIW